jgi:hypothetical protein
MASPSPSRRILKAAPNRVIKGGSRVVTSRRQRGMTDQLPGPDVEHHGSQVVVGGENCAAIPVLWTSRPVGLP